MDNSQPIDWESVWKSLAWVDYDEDEAAIQKRLQQRARQYAAPKQALEPVIEVGLTMLTFELGDEHYGIDVMAVRGVRTVNHITRVPGTPAFYRGVVNVRGQVVTVLDLRLFFEMPVTEETVTPDELVITRVKRLEIGLLAHNIEGVRVVPRSAVEPLEGMRYGLGVTADQLVLLDVESLFADDRLMVGGKDRP